ncbi:MAG: hypothetical protein ACLQDV_09040 [Candidatus Binataceae bacterium]
MSTNQERRESAHRHHQIVERPRHLERYHQQRQRKTEDHIAQRFQAQHIVSAHPKIRHLIHHRSLIPHASVLP